MQNAHANTHRGTTGLFATLEKEQRRDIKRDNLPQFECDCLLPCKYVHTFLFLPHSSHRMLSLSTCRLIPLFTAGQQVNWYPPTRRRQGSTLMKLCLGAPVLAGYTLGVMISSVALGHRIWLPQSSPGCLLKLTRLSQFRTAQQVCRHTDS